MTASPTPRADDMVRNQAVASLMRQELTDETPAESYFRTARPPRHYRQR